MAFITFEIFSSHLRKRCKLRQILRQIEDVQVVRVAASSDVHLVWNARRNTCRRVIPRQGHERANRSYNKDMYGFRTWDEEHPISPKVWHFSASSAVSRARGDWYAKTESSQCDGTITRELLMFQVSIFKLCISRFVHAYLYLATHVFLTSFFCLNLQELQLLLATVDIKALGLTHDTISLVCFSA